MLKIKNICDYEAMAQKDWQKAIKDEFKSWADDWQYCLGVAILTLLII